MSTAPLKDDRADRPALTGVAQADRTTGPSPSPMADNPAREALGRLAAMLQMEERLRRAEKKELPFIVVNETRLLVGYRQAVLWRYYDDGTATPLGVSGQAVPEKNSPYIQSLRRILAHLRQRPPSSVGPEILFTATDLPESLREDWTDWLPAYGLLVPIPLWPFEHVPAKFSAAPSSPQENSDGALVQPDSEKNDSADASPPNETEHQPVPGGQIKGPQPPESSPTENKIFGGLLLFGQRPFSQGDLRVLRHLAGAYGQALSLAYEPRRRNWGPSRILKAAAVALLLIGMFPVRFSVLTPAEVIAGAPWPVRSGLDGIVEEILVEPNAPVRKGQVLLVLDRTELRTRLAVAVKSLEIARVELRQARQLALGDREAKLRLAASSGRLEQLEAERAYVESLLERAVVRSPIDGLALVDNPEEWAGRPVALGQRIMTVADPTRLRLEIFLPQNDYLPQEPGDEVLFFPNVSPGSPRRAVVGQAGFQAHETVQAGMAFRLRADFQADENLPRMGVRGSAKLYGKRAPLVYVILRKPLFKLRQWLGV